MPLESFQMLEESLKRLLASVESLKAENSEIKDALRLKDLEIKGLKDRLRKLDREKGVVKERVDQLLKKLDVLVQGA